MRVKSLEWHFNMDASSLLRFCAPLRHVSRAGPVHYRTGLSKLLARASSNQTAQVFRTQEDDPRQHTLDHVGLFYRVDPIDLNTVLKGFIHPYQQRLIKTFNEACFMVRSPSLELESYLRNINYDHPVNKFVLYGPRGSGKSNSLLHTVHSCHRNGWIILHVPWGSNWVRGFKKEIAESSYKSGRIDLPTDAAEWLSYFRLKNQNKLKGFKTTSEYVWTRREKAEAGTPLEEIINFGLNRLKFSSDAMGVVLKELRLQAKSSGIKILVAVEGVNGFFVQWENNHSIKNSEKKVIEPHEISIVHNMKKMMEPTWSNGAVVCTVDDQATGYRDNYTPLYLLRKEGYEFLDPFVPIHVPEYSEKEANTCLNYYIDRNWIQNETAKTEQGKKQVIFVSNKNPLNLHEVCASL